MLEVPGIHAPLSKPRQVAVDLGGLRKQGVPLWNHQANAKAVPKPDAYHGVAKETRLPKCVIGDAGPGGPGVWTRVRRQGSGKS